MKLFVFCFGAVLAAAVVSAEETADANAHGPDTPIDICGEDWYATGGPCFDVEIGETPPCFQNTSSDYVAVGICCGTNQEHKLSVLSKIERDICIDARENGCVDMENANCGVCTFFKPSVLEPEVVGACCTNDCCNEALHEPLTYLERAIADFGSFSDEDAIELLKSWLVYDFDNKFDVFVGPKVSLCSSDSYPFEFILNGARRNASCYELCCPCCYNLDQTFTFVAKNGTHGDPDAYGDSCYTSAYMSSMPVDEQRHHYQGGASICIDEEGEIGMFSNHFGLVVWNANETTTHDYRGHFSCSKKLDGGNSGYPIKKNGTNTTAY